MNYENKDPGIELPRSLSFMDCFGTGVPRNVAYACL